MLNEGIIVNDAKSLVKTAIVKQIRRLHRATPEELEQAVFMALVGHPKEEVDWDVEDNQAGYYSWLMSYDQLISELIEDGYMIKEAPAMLVATEADPDMEYSHLVYPTGHFE